MLKVPEKLKIWFEVRKKYKLSDAQIQMARELGLNPKKFGSLANSNQGTWKLPLPEFIEEIYLKKFGREKPVEFISLEAKMEKNNLKKKTKIEKKQNEKLIESKNANEEKNCSVPKKSINYCIFCGSFVGDISERTGNISNAVFHCPKCQRIYCDQCSYSKKIKDKMVQYCLRCDSKLEEAV